jgi:hypothetical protein
MVGSTAPAEPAISRVFLGAAFSTAPEPGGQPSIAFCALDVEGLLFSVVRKCANPTFAASGTSQNWPGTQARR